MTPGIAWLICGACLVVFMWVLRLALVELVRDAVRREIGDDLRIIHSRLSVIEDGLVEDDEEDES